MFDTKLEVDKHVDNCLKKIHDENERKLRSFLFAKLYFKVGDYEQARRYVSSYLAVKPLSTEGLNLLGNILEKQGKRELAVEAYRKSLDIDSKQNSLVIKICELLASDEVGLDLSGARYYCEKAQSIDPHNPIIFNLKERLVAAESQDPNDVSELLLAELASRPTDIYLRVRLLHHLLQYNRINEAYKHACDIEQKNLPIFANSLNWYEAVAEVLVHYQQNNLVKTNLTWEFWMVKVSVLDKLVALTLAEHISSLKSTSECAQVLFNFDQALNTAAENLNSCTEKPLVQEFLNHYKGQLCFHFVTLLFKHVKRDLITYKEMMQFALPLLFASYHTKPAELRSIWLDNSSEVRRLQMQRWHNEAAFRCSQTGHLLLAIAKDRKLTIIEKAIQSITGLWREHLFKKLFITRDLHVKLKTSYFISCPCLLEITVRLPEICEVIKYDEVAQLLYPDSLHLFIWMCVHKKLSTFRCTVFEGIQYSIKNLNNCAAESLNLLDIESFLYCASICAQQQQQEKKLQLNYNREHPDILPATVTDLLGTVNQTKWLRAAYKMYRNEYGAELSELRLNLIRGIEVVRCVGNHGIDVKLLVLLATTFAERAKNCSKQSEIEFNDARSELYWKAALPLLERLQKNQAIFYASNRLFEYKSKEMAHAEIISYIDDAKLFIASQFMKKKEYEKALQLFEEIKSPYASFNQAHIYKTMANDQMAQHKECVTSEMRSQHVILLSRARDCLYLTVDRLRDPSVDRKHPLNTCLGSEIEKIERLLNRFDSDVYTRNELDGMSEENASSAGSMGDHVNNSYMSAIGNTFQYNESVTPIYDGRHATSHRLRFDTPRREARPSPERLDAQLRQIQASRDATINQVLDQNRLMVESHRSLVDELRNFRDAVTNLTSTVEDLRTVKDTVNDELKSIKSSVTELKTTVDSFNFADVSDLIQEMKKEISELKKDKSKHNPLSGEDLYALDDDYDGDYNFSPNNLYPNLAGRLQGNPVTFPPALYPSLYPMYPYTGLGLSQSGTLPYGQEAQLNDIRMLNSISQGIPQSGFVQPTISAWQPGTQVSQQPSISVLPSGVNENQLQVSASLKDIPVTSTATNVSLSVSNSQNLTPYTTVSNVIPTTSKKAPINVVITSSDPLPTTSVQTTQVLSVTIPPQHLKGNISSKQPHNFQIPLPATAVTSLTTTPSIMYQPSPVISTEGFLSSFAPPVYSAVNMKSPIKSTELGLRIENTLSQSFGSSSKKDENSLNKSNTSSTSVEEHDPCADFKPIVPLPDEVPVTTGEENEKVLFSEHAKLFRFVNKEWRERGIGILKILRNEENVKVRILMRRDQVHKICANHYLTKDMHLSGMPKSNRAYVWAANDFADGEMNIEKFCVRFKTVEQAKAFFTAFESAKKDLPNTLVTEKVTNEHIKLLPSQSDDKSSTTVTSTTITKSKSLGGFIFTSPPTFKTMEPAIVPKVISPQNIQKSSLFAKFTFGAKSATTPPNIFSSTSNPVITSTSQKDTTLVSPKTPDEFIPTAEFTPVITLPEFIDVKTGEENAEILFEERAKLLRYEATSKEWKERGTGNMKLLKQNNTIRLLMRREHVHKVCCNHQLLKNTVFSKMPKNPNVLTWSAQDYSENVFKTEIFTIRFKTLEQTSAFAAAIELAKSSLDDDNFVKSEENSDKDLGTSEDRKEDKKIKGEPKVDSPKLKSWDEFKPKQGCWECKNCYIINEAKTHVCMACETIKPNTSPRKSIENSLATTQFSFGTGAVSTTTDANKSQIYNVPSSPPSARFIFGQKAVTPATFSWGDAFKPKPGSWECPICLVRNTVDKLSCFACEHPKDGPIPKESKGSVNPETTGTQFSFGFPTKEKTVSDNTASSWGDTFKPKPGTWECKLCYVRNDAEKLYCLSCESHKDDTVPKKDKGIDLSTPGFQFQFGIPQTSANTSDTFSFTSKPAGFGTPHSQVTSENVFNVDFDNKNKDAAGNNQFVFGSPQQHAFEFTPRSPRRYSSGCQGDEDPDHFVEDEGDQIYFKPVIPLPDKIDVKSGEEDEQVLYCHRAKLFRFVQGEWKERGVGDVKILARLDTGKVRVLMRRDHVLKICLNHNLAPEIEYLPKDDDKTWLFSAPDYSEGELNHWQFCIRFKNGEIAQEFKKAIENALKTPKDNLETTLQSNKHDSDVEFISETKVTPEEEEEALKLKLPRTFMSYRQQPDCTCERCKKEDEFLGEIYATKPLTMSNQSDSLKSILIKPALFANVGTEIQKQAPISTDANLFSPQVSTGNESSFNTFKFTLKTTPTTSDVKFSETTSFVMSNTSSTLTNVTATTSSMISTGSLFSTPISTGISNIFGGGAAITSVSKNPFDTTTSTTSTANTNMFGTFTNTSSNIFDNTQSTEKLPLFDTAIVHKPKSEQEICLKFDSNLNFAAVAASNSNTAFATKPQDNTAIPFASLGAGAPVFASLSKKPQESGTVKDTRHLDDEAETENSNEAEHDPHFEPIIPLPAVITVSTGEEDEIAIFNERAKVYRYNNHTKEWKERGVGQLKILHHPIKGTYRFLLRREQVHKVVLNMLISSNLELQPMSTSDKAWLWCGQNHVEGEAALEQLAARFKNCDLAKHFYNAAMQAIAALKEKQDAIFPSSVQNFEEVNTTVQHDHAEYRDEEEDVDDEDDDNRSVMFVKNCIFSEELDTGEWKNVCSGTIHVYYDSEMYGSRICIANDAGVPVSNTIIGINTEMMIQDNDCIWRAVEWIDDVRNPHWRTMKVTFEDAESTEAFHCTFLESLQFAQETELVDGIFVEDDNDDDEEQ